MVFIMTMIVSDIGCELLFVQFFRSINGSIHETLFRQQVELKFAKT